MLSTSKQIALIASATAAALPQKGLLPAGPPGLTPWGRGVPQLSSALRSSRSYTGSFSSSSCASEGMGHYRDAQENMVAAADRSRDALDIACLVDNTPFTKVVKIRPALSGLRNTLVKSLRLFSDSNDVETWLGLTAVV